MSLSSVPSTDCRSVGAVAPFTVSGAAWTTLFSNNFSGFSTGLALAAGQKFVAVIVNNTGTSGSIWISGQETLGTETPSTVPGAVQVRPGQSLTLGLYGTDYSCVAYAGDAGATGQIVATFFPY